MGNIIPPSNGIKSGTRIHKNCSDCGVLFETWSDDTLTIKGPIHPQLLCQECNTKLNDNVNFDFIQTK